MRILAVYHKGEKVAYISHLDVQRTLHRAFRRAGIPLAFSKGFNPHPELSFASAVPTGTTSDCEFFEVQLAREMTPESFLERVNAVMPDDFFLSDARILPEGFGSLSSKTRLAEYTAVIALDEPASKQAWEAAVQQLLSEEIIVQKRTKSGIKPLDIRPQIHRVSVEKVEGTYCTLRVLGKLAADGGLRVDQFVTALLDRLAAHGTIRVHREAMYFDSDGFLPRLPLD